MRSKAPEYSPQQEMQEAHLQPAVQAQTSQPDAEVVPNWGIRDTVQGEVLSSHQEPYKTSPNVLRATEAAMPKPSRRATSGPISLNPARFDASATKSGEPLPKFPGLPKPATLHKIEAGEIVARKTKATARNKNGTRRLYQADENGKLRPISQAKVLELNGYGPDVITEPTVSIEPKVADVPSVVTAKAESRPVSPNQSRRQRLGKLAMKAVRASLNPLDRIDDATLAFVDKKFNTAAGRVDQLNDWGLAAENRIKDNFAQDAHPVANAKKAATERLDMVNEWGLEKDAAIKKLYEKRYAGAQTGFARARAYIASAKLGERASELANQANDWGLGQDKKISEKAQEVLKRRRGTTAAALGMVAVATLTLGFGGESNHSDAKTSAAHTQEEAPGALAKFDLDSNLLFKAMPKVAIAAEQQDPKVAKPAEAKPPIKPEVTKPELTAEPLTVKAGDHLWNVLENAGIPQAEIMQRLDMAAKASGINYEWHGSGENRWLEVDGKSDAKSIVSSLDKFIKR